MGLAVVDVVAKVVDEVGIVVVGGVGVVDVVVYAVAIPPPTTNRKQHV